VFLISLGILKLISRYELLQRWLLALISFFLIIPIHNQAFAIEMEAKMNQKTCENYALTSEIQNRYDKIRKNLEKDFNSGLPYKLRTQLIDLRGETDQLSQKLFDVSDINDQEVNSLMNDTVDRLEKFIQLIPEISSNAPKVRTQYVVPFTNLSSLRAEHQECLMSIAIQQAKDDAKNDDATAIDDNIYQKLTEELKNLNANLYQAETSDVQRFVALRSELLNLLESYNKEKDKSPETSQQVVKNIPKALNAVQTEIERLLPGLKLSKKYYSIVE
jgi:hypothetical protein